jgi:hypothetical protein
VFAPGNIAVIFGYPAFLLGDTLSFGYNQAILTGVNWLSTFFYSKDRCSTEKLVGLNGGHTQLPLTRMGGTVTLSAKCFVVTGA